MNHEISRRHFVTAATASAGCFDLFGWLRLHSEELRQTGTSCILLWMQGGPSQLETFDPKPDHPNGGPTKAIPTAVSGIHIAEHWPELAREIKEVAIIRSMTNREANHQRATYQLHTGYVPSGSIKYPTFGSVVAAELGDPKSDLPAFVTVGSGNRGGALSGGFLGSSYNPFAVRKAGRKPSNTETPVPVVRQSRRLSLLGRLEGDFASSSGKDRVDDHRTLYARASRFSFSSKLDVFDFDTEPSAVREAYGDTEFGRGCLLARRLVEAGVPFVEARLNGWDTHADNFDRSVRLAAQVDQSFAQLIRDLRDRGRLDKTLIVWMGEFGRTPRINGRSGRDHFPAAFNVAIAGGGVRGGQVIGKTTDDGMAVADRPVTVPDLFASLCHSLGINPEAEKRSALGRPVPIVDEGNVITELFG